MMRDQITLSEKAAEFLEEVRGIPCEIASRYAVTIRGKIAFEFRRGGAVEYRKLFAFNADGRRAGEVCRDRRGTETILFNLDALSEPSVSKTLIITEGEIDALSCMAGGMESVVSVPDGAGSASSGEGEIVIPDDTGFKWLWNREKTGLLPGFEQFTKVILAVDDDEKGRVLLDELAVRLGRSRCYVPKWPDGCKDANDVLVKHGPVALGDILNDAAPLVANKLIDITEVRRADYRVYELGIKGLDDHLKIHEHALGVITGPPSHGKTQFATLMLGEFALQNDLPVAFLCLEDAPDRVKFDLETIAMRRLGIRNRFDAEKALKGRVYFLGPDEDLDDEIRDAAWLEHTIWEAAVRHGCKLMVIDPWNELQHVYEKQYTVAQYLNSTLQRIAKLARRYRMAIFIVAHPSKEGGQTGSIKSWNLYELDGGAAWRNKVTHGIVVLRNDEDADQTFIKVAKIKDQFRLGSPGIVTTKFNRGNMSFDFVCSGIPPEPRSSS